MGLCKFDLPREGWPDAIEDAKNSNMSREVGKDEAREVMEALEPHRGLGHLKIMHYDGEKLPVWLCTLIMSGSFVFMIVGMWST